MVWYQIWPALMNFVLRKLFNFLLSIFTMPNLMFFMLLKQSSNMKKQIVSQGGALTEKQIGEVFF